MIHVQLPFGIVILCLTIYGALSKPRTTDVALTHTLHRDGIVFFLVRFSDFTHRPKCVPYIKF